MTESNGGVVIRALDYYIARLGFVFQKLSVFQTMTHLSVSENISVIGISVE